MVGVGWLALFAQAALASVMHDAQTSTPLLLWSSKPIVGKGQGQQVNYEVREIMNVYAEQLMPLLPHG